MQREMQDLTFLGVLTCRCGTLATQIILALCTSPCGGGGQAFFRTECNVVPSGVRRNGGDRAKQEAHVPSCTQRLFRFGLSVRG